MNVVFGFDQTIHAWALNQFNHPLINCHSAVGIVDNTGTLKGAAIFQDFNGSNIVLTYFGPQSVTKTVFTILLAYAFTQLKVNRVTVLVKNSNRIVKTGLPKLGFKLEGVMRRYYGNGKGNTALIFGLHRETAMQILSRHSDGRVIRQAEAA